ncbi:class I SAM-dependent methyltransferase [Deltaproteobacteria bacterium IMCC39524]|nr:class I SAM-dependent methyltransferase [Deltaproteobacteria bacterium IMCC39524]
MAAIKGDIDSSYSKFYADRVHRRVYPTEFVVRTFLADYPGLHYKKPQPGDSVLDVAFGDGRNTVLLCDLGLDVSGIEITADIVQQTGTRLAEMGYHPDLRVGRNSSIPYEDGSFDYILACHCCYYCDEGETLIDNLKEYQRVLKPGGALIASVADRKSYIFQEAEELHDGTMRIKNDPYCNRDGYRLHGFHSNREIEEYFSGYFGNFSFGHANNEYFGIQEQVFWVVCEKKL